MQARAFTANGTVVREGDTITIDGFTGNVFVGELPLADSVLEKARQGDEEARQEPIWKAFERLMQVADERRRMRVRANADTPEQSTNARERGAEGIGLCRTEHMFLGSERVGAVQQMIFAETAEEEQAAYDALLPLQRGDFVGIFRAMDGLPVTVRLLDPPLHEFLPDLTELSVEVALGRERGEDMSASRSESWRRCDSSTRRTRCSGSAACGWASSSPVCTRCRCARSSRPRARCAPPGATRQVEIMIPLVATVGGAAADAGRARAGRRRGLRRGGRRADRTSSGAR